MYLNTMNFLEFLQPMPVVGILRDIPQGAEEACVNASAKCGLKAIEVTMNTFAAAEIITKIKSFAKPLGIKVGAGTVRHGSDVEKAISAGAEFLVTPNTRHEVIRLSNTAGIPIIPGALTPTEVQKAYDLGATAIKIFPVNCVSVDGLRWRERRKCSKLPQGKRQLAFVRRKHFQCRTHESRRLGNN